MTALRLELPEYDLADEIRRLPYDHARKLARAAAEATNGPPSARALERLSADEWEGLAADMSEEACRTAFDRMGAVHGWIEVLGEDGKKAVLESLDADDVVEALKAEHDRDGLEEVAGALDDDMRDALRREWGDDEKKAEPKLWFVFQAMPRAPRARKRRVFRFVAVAPSAEAAVELVRADRPRTLHECEWTAEEVEGYAAIDWELEK